MRYCYSCNRLTTGEPVFCSVCGKTYDVKLCPRLHVNTRYSEVCSQCGSRDLSTPQPKVPFWGRVLAFLVTFTLGAALSILSLLFVLVFLREVFSNSNALNMMFGIGILLALLWWMWAQVPHWLRKRMHRILSSKRSKER